MQFRKLLTRRFLFRTWLYFRTGYGTYVSFALGFISFVTTVYYLAINNLPFLKIIFSSFIRFVVFFAVVAPPVCILVGWLHIKRSRAYSSEINISTEANPYIYEVQPGKEREVDRPFTVASIEVILAIAEALGEVTGKTIMTPERKQAYMRAWEQNKRLVDQGDYRSKPQ